MAIYFWAFMLGVSLCGFYVLVLEPVKKGTYKPGFFNIVGSVVCVYTIYFVLFKFDLIHKLLA